MKQPKSTERVPNWGDNQLARQYFDKFSAIPDDQWCTDKYINGCQKCVMGHLGVRLEEQHPFEAVKFRLFINKYFDTPPETINDDFGHPKYNILEVLQFIIRMTNYKPIEKI